MAADIPFIYADTPTTPSSLTEVQVVAFFPAAAATVERGMLNALAAFPDSFGMPAFPAQLGLTACIILRLPKQQQHLRQVFEVGCVDRDGREVGERLVAGEFTMNSESPRPLLWTAGIPVRCELPDAGEYELVLRLNGQRVSNYPITVTPIQPPA